MNNNETEKLLAEWNKIRPRYDELHAEWAAASRQGIESFTVWFNGNKAKVLEIVALEQQRSLIKKQLKDLSFDLNQLV